MGTSASSDTLLLTLVVCSIHRTMSESYLAVDEGLTTLPTIPNTVDKIILSKNQLSLISNFPSFPNLISLHLNINALKEFPNVKNAGPTLQELHLNHNQISKIDISILEQLISLMHLDLAYNRLTAFEDVVGPSNTLVFLNLEHNSLSTIPRLEMLGRKLKTLNMNRNDFTKATKNDFVWFKSMEKLNLFRTNLRVFPSMSGMGGSLVELVLTDNNIHTLPLSDLAQMRSIKYVYMNNNEVSTIPNLCLVPSVDLAVAFFVSAPLVCDCRMRWLKWHTAHCDVRTSTLVAFCQQPVAAHVSLVDMDHYACHGEHSSLTLLLEPCLNENLNVIFIFVCIETGYSVSKLFHMTFIIIIILICSMSD